MHGYNSDIRHPDKVNQLQNKIARLEQIRAQALDCMVTLAKSVWNGEKYLIVKSDLPAEFLQKFHAPLIKYESITHDHWAWQKISEKDVKLNEKGLKNFIMRTSGTYAIISVQLGVHSGDHLMYVYAI